jgi:hypothetical protein
MIGSVVASACSSTMKSTTSAVGRDEALEMCAAPRRLGLTASPPDGTALARVSTLVGPIAFELHIRDLAGQWLADFDDVVIALRLTADEQSRYDAANRGFRAAFDQYRMLHRTVVWSEFVATASCSEAGRAALASFQETRRLTNYPEAKRTAWPRQPRTARAVCWCSHPTTDRHRAPAPHHADHVRHRPWGAPPRWLLQRRATRLGERASPQQGIDVGRRCRDHRRRHTRPARARARVADCFDLPGKRATVREFRMRDTHEQRVSRYAGARWARRRRPR